MAFAGNTTFNATVDRENLEDMITIMTPTDLPLHALLDSEPTDNPYLEKIVDELATPTATQAEVEGKVATFAVGPEVKRITAGVSIVDKTVEVSDTRRNQDEAGFQDAYNYQIYKKSIEMFKQVEYNMHWDIETTKPTTNGTARRTTGLMSWLGEVGLNLNSPGGGATIHGVDIGSTYAPVVYDPGAPANITRDQFHANILLPARAKGMNIDYSTLLCGATLKRLLSGFALTYASGGTYRRNSNQEDKKMVDTIDVFESDVGVIFMNMDRYMDGTETVTWNVGAVPTVTNFVVNKMLAVIEPDKYHRLVYRGLSHIPIAKVGDSTRGMLISEQGLSCDNPLAGVLGVDCAA